jgi:hypothetical protein
MGDGLPPLSTLASRAGDSWHSSAEEEVVEPDFLLYRNGTGARSPDGVI